MRRRSQKNSVCNGKVGKDLGDKKMKNINLLLNPDFYLADVHIYDYIQPGFDTD